MHVGTDCSRIDERTDLNDVVGTIMTNQQPCSYMIRHVVREWWNLVYSIFIQLTPLLGLFSGRLHQVPKQPKLSLNYLYFTVFSSLFFLTIYPNPPCHVFPCGRKPENTEKTHDFRMLTNSSNVWSDARYRLEPVTSVLGGRRLDDWATEAPHPLGGARGCTSHSLRVDNTYLIWKKKCGNSAKHFFSFLEFMWVLKN